MKKILAILSGVAMLFASCTQSETLPRPEFPEVAEQNVLAGGTYSITFTADVPWRVSLPAEAQQYAKLYYDGYLDTSHSGPAGENTIKIRVNQGAGSYFSDVTFNVEITMNRYTENLVVCTLPKLTRKVVVTGGIVGGFEANCKSALSKDEHPADSPFADALYKYKVTHIKSWDAKEGYYYIMHDVDVDYNYCLYGRDKTTGEFVQIAEEEKSWLSYMAFGRDGEQKVRVMMDYENGGVLTENVGYEAYLNVEDRNKNVIISVYYLFDPRVEEIIPTSFGLANAELAAEKGVKLESNGDKKYTLTIPTLDILQENSAAAALKWEGYTEITPGFDSETLVLKHDEESDTYIIGIATTTKVENVLDPETGEPVLDEDGKNVTEEITTPIPVENLVRNNVLTVYALAEENQEYVITVILEWAKENEVFEEETEE